MMLRLFFALLAAASFSLAAQENLSFADLKKQPCKSVSFYDAEFRRDAADKIQALPANVLAYLRTMDCNKSYANYSPDAGEKALFEEYWVCLPESLKEVFREKVLAVYFVKNFMGAGMTDEVFDDAGDAWLVLYLNPDLFRKNLTEWLQYRDSSCFSKESRHAKFVVACSKDYKALLYALVHESCHAYDYIRRFTPYVEPRLKAAVNGPQDFVRGVWADYAKPETSCDFGMRDAISFYGLGKRVDPSNAARLVDALSRSPFSSLYGAKNWADDFAETFTWHYLKMKFNIEYEISVFDGNAKVAGYIPTDNEAVKARYGLFGAMEQSAALP